MKAPLGTDSSLKHFDQVYLSVYQSQIPGNIVANLAADVKVTRRR